EDQLASAIGATPAEDIVGARATERALEGADKRLRRVGREIGVAALAIGTQLKHDSSSRTSIVAATWRGIVGARGGARILDDPLSVPCKASVRPNVNISSDGKSRTTWSSERRPACGRVHAVEVAPDVGTIAGRVGVRRRSADGTRRAKHHL